MNTKNKFSFNRSVGETNSFFRALSYTGQALGEYLIIVVLVGIGLIVGIKYFNASVSDKYSEAKTQIDDLSGDSQSALVVEDSGSDKNVKSTANQKSEDDSSVSSKNIDDQPINEIEIDRNFIWILALLTILVALLFIVKFLKKAKSNSEDDNSTDESGQAMVEFLFVSITFLFIILGIIQLAMILNARILVEYAAYNSVRAGIVHNGNLEKMKEAARISLTGIFPKHGRAVNALGMTENYIAAKETDQYSSYTEDGKNITDVKIIAPNTSDVITFDDYTHVPDSVLTIQVEHQYELVVPLVNRIAYFVHKKMTQPEDSSIDKLSSETDKLRRDGEFNDIEYRVPIVATRSMRLQSDFEP